MSNPKTTTLNPPSDDLVRALSESPTVEEDADGAPRHLFGHFAVFNRWTEIDSMVEGHFMERIAPGAFAKTIAEQRDRVRVLYDHGADPALGNKPLGPVRELAEDGRGVYYDVELIDTDYNRDFIVPAVEAGVLGASFRFRVLNDDWNDKPRSSKTNPDGLPQRTIREVSLYEFGPVTFPAYAGATAAVRSLTDRFATPNPEQHGEPGPATAEPEPPLWHSARNHIAIATAIATLTRKAML